MLQDDPAFLPDDFFSSLDLDFPSWGSTQASSQLTDILSDQLRLSSVSSGAGGGFELGSVGVPSTGSGFAGIHRSFISGSSVKHVPHLLHPSMALQGEDDFFPDVDFQFDAEGNIIELQAPTTTVDAQVSGLPRVRSDSLVGARIGEEHAVDMVASQAVVSGNEHRTTHILILFRCTNL